MNEQELLKRIFAEYGRKGAAARAKRLTPEQRSDIARKAANTRWQQKQQKKKTDKQKPSNKGGRTNG